jgi:Spy/CpxP family protein refolding chaperone
MHARKFLLPLIACAVGALSVASAVAQTSPVPDRKAFDKHDFAGADNPAKREDRIADRLALTDAQKALFKDLRDFHTKQRADREAAFSANKPDLTSFEKQLAFRQTILETQLADLKAEAPRLVAFYNSLDDKQKAEFAELGARGERGREDGRGQGQQRHEPGDEHGTWGHDGADRGDRGPHHEE